MFGLGTGELIIIGIVVFIFVGPKKLPQLGSALARGIRNFKDEMNPATVKVEVKKDNE